MLARMLELLHRRRSSAPAPKVAVFLDDGKLAIGKLGEKVAGGLFEVVLEKNGREVSAIFRLDELLFISEKIRSVEGCDRR